MQLKKNIKSMSVMYSKIYHVFILFYSYPTLISYHNLLFATHHWMVMCCNFSYNFFKKNKR